jgi:hypothetical protein
MLVTSLVLTTQPGRAHSVADLVGRIHGMQRLSVEGDHSIRVTWSIPAGQNAEPEGLSEVLRSMTEEILEVALLDAEENGS